MMRQLLLLVFSFLSFNCLIGLYNQDFIVSQAIQPDGKILEVGSKVTMTAIHALIKRKNPDQSLDNTFGINGVTTFFDSW